MGRKRHHNLRGMDSFRGMGSQCLRVPNLERYWEGVTVGCLHTWDSLVHLHRSLLLEAALFLDAFYRKPWLLWWAVGWTVYMGNPSSSPLSVQGIVLMEFFTQMPRNRSSWLLHLFLTLPVGVSDLNSRLYPPNLGALLIQETKKEKLPVSISKRISTGTNFEMYVSWKRVSSTLCCYDLTHKEH